ncbi:MAG: O-antigen ligase domain-containing protein, partial [Winogradskyella sp.]|nr:O-antigen ligase domain-containing protein [Winogradskyella sp.]
MAKILDKNKKYRFTNDAYVALVVAHIVLGIFVNQIAAFSKLYFIIVTVFFVYKVSTVAKHRIKNWVLFGCAYIVAAEALFRMTDGGIFYEFSKYFVILLMLLGIAADGVSSRSYPYFLYLILLIPSIIVASQTLGANFNFRTSIAFALSGPVTLGV